MFAAFLLVSLLTLKSAADKELRIATLDDFYSFVASVENKTTYSGTTVLLDTDLTLSKTIEPIGVSSAITFNGVFNGQGHVIHNLNVTSNSSEVGLFGYSIGLTIRDVVIGPSSSVTSTMSGHSSPSIGGLIGYCVSTTGVCLFENIINMGSVAFSGNITVGSVSLGGIAGKLHSTSEFTSIVRNCASYGLLSSFGYCSFTYIGGIVGYSDGLVIKIYQNCLNYGTINPGMPTKSVSIGGIVGYSYNTQIHDCLSAGKISLVGKSGNQGSIVGYSSTGTEIKECYYTDELSKYGIYGSSNFNLTIFDCFSFDNTTFELSGTVSIGEYSGNSLIRALNAAADYYVLRSYTHWLLNEGGNSVSFVIQDRAVPIQMDHQIILQPNLANKGSFAFDEWYEDSNCTVPLKSYEIVKDTVLYGKYTVNTKMYTISFESRKEGLSVSPMSVQFGSTVTLPKNLNCNDCVVAFWETEYGDNVEFSLIMPAHDLTLYPVWKCERIKSKEDFLDFAKLVNMGTNYAGSTVFLDTDLSLSGFNSPIGKDSASAFSGTFDGQAHVIRNFNVTWSLEYVALFGYSTGMTIRNLVLDDSCSVTSSGYSTKVVYLGGFIGNCHALYYSCIIESCVNMADITFDGSTSKGSEIGGVVGHMNSHSKLSQIKKCCKLWNYLEIWKKF